MITDYLPIIFAKFALWFGGTKTMKQVMWSINHVVNPSGVVTDPEVEE